MGWPTMQAFIWDAKGKRLTHGPRTSKIPMAGDVTETFQMRFFDGANVKPTSYRSKAVGEPPLMPALSAFFAIKDAVSAAEREAAASVVPQGPPAQAQAATEVAAAAEGDVETGARQGSCRLIHAANGCLSREPECVLTTESVSGFKVTASMGVQLRVAPDRRRGLRSRAWQYSSWRAARIAVSAPAWRCAGLT
jgi:hypothetical protein